MVDITASAYLVNGFYFQDREFPRIGMDPSFGEVVLIDQGLFRCMYSGIIQRNDAEEWQGFLQDVVGQSTLSWIHFDSVGLSFTKQYDLRHRPDSIEYRFEPVGDYWAGSYCGEWVGSGYANCILTPVPAGFTEQKDSPVR